MSRLTIDRQWRVALSSLLQAATGVGSMHSGASTTAGRGKRLTFGGLSSGGLLIVLNDLGGNDSALSLEGSGNDIGGDAEGLGEESNTGVGDGVVAPLPGEDFLKEAL